MPSDLSIVLPVASPVKMRTMRSLTHLVRLVHETLNKFKLTHCIPRKYKNAKKISEGYF